MKTNVGSFDAAVRFVAGCGLLLLGNHGLGWWGLIGFVPILTAICAFCPAYALLSVSTTAWDRRVQTEARTRPGRARHVPRAAGRVYL